MELIRKYFPDISRQQTQQFNRLMDIFPRLNENVNMISRKDIDHLEERHIMHSLSIARAFPFSPGSTVIDAGTGGGFPGIPLAILFPEAKFILVDSTAKKIRMVEEIITYLDLKAVNPMWKRLEELDIKADFVVSRAVAPLGDLDRLTGRLIRKGVDGNIPHGLITLKGGDLEEELEPFHDRVQVYPIKEWFSEPYFSTKKIVFLKK
jgi:16S rRNA (guanine527-N7)-methyltransferase